LRFGVGEEVGLGVWDCVRLVVTLADACTDGDTELDACREGDTELDAWRDCDADMLGV